MSHFISCGKTPSTLELYGAEWQWTDSPAGSPGTPEAGLAPTIWTITWLGFSVCDTIGHGSVCTYGYQCIAEINNAFVPQYSSQSKQEWWKKWKPWYSWKAKVGGNTVPVYTWGTTVEFRARPWCSEAFIQIFWKICSLHLSIDICIMETYKRQRN